MAASPACSISTDFFANMMPPFAWTTPYPQEQPTAPIMPALVSAEQTNGAVDREQVLMDHLPLVRFVARRIHERLPQHVELEDLVSAGIVGLIDAFNKFDSGKNVQFRSYAQFRVRGAILDSLRTLDWGSRELRRKGRSIEEATQKLTHQLNRRPSESEVAADLGMELGQYQELLGELKSLEIGSLHETRNEDSSEEELAYVPTAPEEDPLYRCMKNEMSAQLSAAIADLPERDARVLVLYYVEEMTQKEIGAVLGLVESRVSQIRSAAVNRLRTVMSDGKTQPKVVPFTGSKRRLYFAPAAEMRQKSASLIRNGGTVLAQ